MKLHHYQVIVLTLILSVSYIFGIDYYDQKENYIQDLFEKVNLQNINYDKVNVQLLASGEEDFSLDELAQKQSETVTMLSHRPDCSKLCAEVHDCNLTTEFTPINEKMGMIINDLEPNVDYNFTVSGDKELNHTSYYKMSITGLEDLQEVDNIRELSYNLFHKWKLTPKEYIAFEGTLEGKLYPKDEQSLVNQMFSALKAKKTDYYKDDAGSGAVAYYAYSKDIQGFILNANHQKTNIQISFVYNEKDSLTHVIVAFPFYNEPF